jgi:hypothetical protein
LSFTASHSFFVTFLQIKPSLFSRVFFSQSYCFIGLFFSALSFIIQLLEREVDFYSLYLFTMHPLLNSLFSPSRTTGFIV